jgi:hypothetical protein
VLYAYEVRKLLVGLPLFTSTFYLMAG